MRHLIALVNASSSSGGGSVGCRLPRELWNSLGNSPLYNPITSTGSTYTQTHTHIKHIHIVPAL